jgi:hypothetical protein
MDKSAWIGLSLGLALVTTACGVSEPDSGEVCEEGHCDGLPFADQLKGREDPIAKFLSSLVEANVIDSKGVYHADRASEVAPSNEPLFYTKLVTGLAKVQGCPETSHINYAIVDDLISGNLYPRLVGTVCSDSELVANAFVATVGTPANDGDVSLDDLEMFAWDATQQKYFFYAVTSDTAGELRLEVEPTRCGKCHTTPTDTDPVGMPRIPIMNELTKPWSHWNAGPGGVSESFAIPDEVKGKTNWERYGSDHVAAASRLEKVIRDANALRITPARSKNLFRPAKLEEAMGLIRPLFCDEQMNYVSELNTGEISLDAVLSGGIKSAFRSIQAAWPYAWFNNDTIQLPPTTEDQRLFLVPVRGVAEVTYEAQLQSALTPNHILALRALDWKKPAFSQFRCDMWKEALTAFQDKSPTLSGRNRDAVKVVFEETMKRAGMSTRNLAAGKFIALDDATGSSVTALKEAVAAGNVPTTCDASAFCEVDANGFGAILETYVAGVVDRRAELQTERDRRVCNVLEQVQPAGGHSVHGADARIANAPSFIKVLTGETTGVSTAPTNCP